MSEEIISAAVQGNEVTPLELFFDLVFAFAVSQLSHHLASHLSWHGVAETLVMLLAIFTVWSYTSWAATMFPEEQPDIRTMVLTVMLLGLFMNAAVTRAFTISGWPFVIPLLLIQLGRTIWTIARSSHAVYREHYRRVLVWFLATTPLWIAGAATNPRARLWCWGLAASIELIGTLLAHPVPGRRLLSANVPFDARHMMERCRLFLLIALGETLLTTGATLAEAPLSWMTLTTGAAAMAGTIALWAMSFGRSHQLALGHLEQTIDPIRASRHAVNDLTAMVAGLIAVAVANEMVIAHPHAPGSPTLSLLLCGGPLLFLAAQGFYLWKVPNKRSLRHLLGGIALLLVGGLTLATPAYVSLLLMGATLTVMAVIEQRRNGENSAPREQR